MAIKSLLFDLFGVLLIKDQLSGAWVINQALIDLIKKLKKQSGYKIGLVSNTSRMTVEQFIKQAGLERGFFDVEVLSGEENFSKLDPRFFQLTLQRLDITAKNSLLIDDSQDNILVAQSLGLAVILADKSEEIILKIKNKLKER